MARIGFDKYIVGYKKFATIDDKKLGTTNFEKGNCNVEVKASSISNSGTAQKKFLRDLPLKERKLTVVTGAMIY